MVAITGQVAGQVTPTNPNEFMVGYVGIVGKGALTGLGG